MQDPNSYIRILCSILSYHLDGMYNANCTLLRIILLGPLFNPNIHFGILNKHIQWFHHWFHHLWFE